MLDPIIHCRISFSFPWITDEADVACSDTDVPSFSLPAPPPPLSPLDHRRENLALIPPRPRLLVAANPDLFADKISWICSRCPPQSSHRLTRSHLHALLALSRFLSKSPKSSPSSRSILDFLRSIPSLAFRSSFWPDSSSSSSFFTELLRYISVACKISDELSTEITPLIGGTLDTNITSQQPPHHYRRLSLSDHFHYQARQSLSHFLAAPQS